MVEMLYTVLILGIIVLLYHYNEDEQARKIPGVIPGDFFFYTTWKNRGPIRSQKDLVLSSRI